MSLLVYSELGINIFSGNDDNVGHGTSARREAERLEERGIMEWQAVAGLQGGELLAERVKAQPNSAIEVRELMPDGTEFKAVWSHLKQSGVAKLVTVHFFHED